MTEAVISIPVDFQPEQRAALRRAALKAGIRARSFVSEPTAAYICCQKEIAGASNVAVFDWGGGALDVSILTAENGVIQELAVSGRRLGGNDIDETLARHFHARIMRSGVAKAFEDMAGMERDQIISQSEDAKKRLSTEDFAPILLMRYGGRKIARESVSLEKFQNLIAQKVEDASDVLQQAARKAHITIEQLDSILMVGGSCKMRPIVRRLEQIGGSRVYRPENAQWVVAGGAAFLAEQRPVYKLQHDFGVLMSDGSLYPVFKTGQEIPCQSPEFSFGVVEDTANAVFIFADGQSFSKNAVGVIRARLREEIGEFVDEERLIIRTFDSFATYMLSDDLPPGLNYDQRIELFIKKFREQPDCLENISYLIVDELQDTVGVRARMLREMLSRMDCGALLLGYRCQSIYDWSVRDKGDCASADLFRWIEKQGFQTGEMERNHRQTKALDGLSAKMRQSLLHGDEEEQERVLDECKACLPTLKEKQLPKVLTGRNELILCKTNGEAAAVSDLFFSGEFVPHTVMRGAGHQSLAPWIGQILGGYTEIQIDKDTFAARAEESGVDGIDEKWAALANCAFLGNFFPLTVRWAR